MGADTFITIGSGKTFDEAFRAAVKQAQWEYGHGGYTGTIAEKGQAKDCSDLFAGYKGIADKTKLKIADLALLYSYYAYATATPKGDMKSVWTKYHSIIARLSDVCDDKWGPAAGFELTGSTAKQYKQKRGDKVFVFIGWASS